MGDKTVGTLTTTPDGRLCAFEYSKEWLAEGFSISPLELPLQQKMFIAKPTPFWGNFGIFEDSLPDGYGRYLLNRMLRKQNIDEQTLTPLQRAVDSVFWHRLRKNNPSEDTGLYEQPLES